MAIVTLLLYRLRVKKKPGWQGRRETPATEWQYELHPWQKCQVLQLTGRSNCIVSLLACGYLQLIYSWTFRRRRKFKLLQLPCITSAPVKIIHPRGLASRYFICFNGHCRCTTAKVAFAQGLIELLLFPSFSLSKFNITASLPWQENTSQQPLVTFFAFCHRQPFVGERE